MKGKSLRLLFIAVPFMGRIMESFAGFSRTNDLPNTYNIKTYTDVVALVTPLYASRIEGIFISFFSTLFGPAKRRPGESTMRLANPGVHAWILF
ncbi:hypothetical protein SAMN05428975_0203 [Mucilaginibacter sp. OK268]|nr:hypothetical protein SAMN05428975_0203 [Mucilaginibacter sp. OK268]